MRSLIATTTAVLLIAYIDASSNVYQIRSHFSRRGLQVVGGANNAVKQRWDPLEAAERIRPKAETQKSPPTSISTDRRACGIYLWNVLSAAKYHLCRYLLRDRVYEGRGGRRFVRIEPGSLLQLLYPLSQHSPDQCMNCGGTMRDHLALWWSKHLYTPYDLNLDRVYKQALVVKNRSKRSTGRQKTKPHSGSRARSNEEMDSSETVYAYHCRYVFDLDILQQLGVREKDEARYLRFAFPNFKWDGSHPFELHALMPLKTSYMIPAMEKNELGRLGTALISFARTIVLREINNLIARQTAENALRSIRPIF